MNDKIATAFLMALAGALVVGILYIFFAPIPEEIGAGNPKDAERIRATVECIKQSGGSKDRDYRLAGYKVAKCAEALDGAITRAILDQMGALQRAHIADGDRLLAEAALENKPLGK